MRRAIAAVGRTLVTAGILILLFVAYQLWGTNILEARAQDDLEREFATLQAEYAGAAPAASGEPGADPGAAGGPAAGDPSDAGGDPSATAGDPSDPDEAEPAALPPLPDFGGGDAMGIIEIPEIGLTKVFVEGTDADDLKKGPGHYAGTPMPGQIGNAAIAGHRTTYGAPFHRLDELEPGDEIIATTLEGRFVYRVRESRVVGPRDVWVVANTPDHPQLTLTTCHPKYSARERLVVWADLVADESAAPTAPEPATTTTTEAPELATEDLSEDELVAALAHGLEGTQRSLGPTWGWGAVVGLVGLGWWWLFRRWRHPLTWLLGVGPFLAFLFVFYIYLERLLPANY